jgi:hypothetical protein
VDGSAAVAAVPGTDFALAIEAADAVAPTQSETRTNTAVGVTYAIAGVSLAAHFWSMENATADDMESVSVKVGYGFGGVSAGLTFATQEMGAAVDNEAIRLDLAYGLGGGMALSTRITAKSDNVNSTNDLTEWRIQLNKAF